MGIFGPACREAKSLLRPVEELQDGRGSYVHLWHEMDLATEPFDLDQIQGPRARTMVNGGLAFCDTGADAAKR